MSFPGFGFTALILCLTGVEVKGGSITCALPGSIVVLPCSNKHPYSNLKWYFKTTDDSKQVVWEELVIHGKYTTSEGKFSLSIQNFAKTDAKSYCCTNKDVTEWCNQKNNEVQIHLADLQVRVLPTQELDKVSLTCRSSCHLSKEPEAYIWYRNGAFLNENWFSRYTALVSSDHTVRYSCGAKGLEHHRAPDVSVDAVTPACFTVTYAWGEMCSNQEQSVDKPCSFIYPRELSVVLDPAEATEGQRVTLRCSTSCTLGNGTAYLWYLDQNLLTWPQSTSQELVLDPVSRQHAGKYSCTLKTYKQIKLSEKTLVVRTNDWWVPSVAARACAAPIATVPLILYFWRRRKQTSGPPPSMEDRNSTELVNMAPVYENSAPQLREQQHLPESTTILYSNVQRSEGGVPLEQHDLV